jgi:hypothetical protein
VGGSQTSGVSTGKGRVFWLFAAAFAVAALFHLAASIDPALDDSSPRWRHLLFVAINAAAAAGMIRRPRGFPLAFAILCAQQLYSHGTALVLAWTRDHRIDVASVIVVTAMPVALALLLRDATSPPAAHRRSSPPPVRPP